MSALAKVKVSMGFTTGGATGFWSQDVGQFTDVTDYVLVSDGVKVKKGRPSEREGIAASTATLTLDNSDNRFNPTWPLGPYYGNLEVNTPIAIHLLDDDDEEHLLFYGYVSSGFPVAEVHDEISTVTIECVDSIGLLQNTPLWHSSYEIETKRPISVSNAPNPNRDFYFELRDDKRSVDVQWGEKALRLWGDSEKVPALTVGDDREVVALQTDALWFSEDADLMVDPDHREQPFTIEMLVKLPTVNGFGSVALWKQDDQRGFFYPGRAWWSANEMGSHVFYATTDGLISYMNNLGEDDYMFWMSNNEADVSETGKVNLFDGKAHHVVLVIGTSQADWKLWIDGKQVAMVRQSQADLGVGDPTQTYMSLGASQADVKHGGVVIQDFQLYKDYRMPDSWVAQRYEAAFANEIYSGIEDYIEHVLLNTTGPFGRVGLAYEGGYSTTGRLVTNFYSTYGRDTVLDLLQLIEDSQQGYFDSQPSDTVSLVRFTDRGGFDPDVGNLVLTFGDSVTGDITYLGESYVSEYDPLDLETVSKVTRLGGEPQIVKAADNFGVYTTLEELEDLLLTSDRQALALAEWRSFTYGIPRERIKAFTVMPYDEDSIDDGFAGNMIETLVNLKPGDLVAVSRTRPDPEDPFVVHQRITYGHIYGSVWSIEDGVLYVTFNFSSARSTPYQGWGIAEWGDELAFWYS